MIAATSAAVEDGAMKTNKTNITIDGDSFNFYFEKSGSNKGAGLGW